MKLIKRFSNSAEEELNCRGGQSYIRTYMFAEIANCVDISILFLGRCSKLCCFFTQNWNIFIIFREDLINVKQNFYVYRSEENVAFPMLYKKNRYAYTNISYMYVCYMCVCHALPHLWNNLLYEFPKVTISLVGFAFTFFSNNFYKWFRRKFTEK